MLIKHIYNEENGVADFLSNQTIDQREYFKVTNYIEDWGTKKNHEGKIQCDNPYHLDRLINQNSDSIRTRFVG